MATKTISLELDAYEKLRRAKKGGESFSAVVRRARFSEAGVTDSVVREKSAAYGAPEASLATTEEYRDRFELKEQTSVALESFDAAARRQQQRNREWTERSSSVSKEEAGRGWTREQLYADRLGEA